MVIDTAKLTSSQVYVECRGTHVQRISFASSWGSDVYHKNNSVLDCLQENSNKKKCSGTWSRPSDLLS